MQENNLFTSEPNNTELDENLLEFLTLLIKADLEQKVHIRQKRKEKEDV